MKKTTIYIPEELAMTVASTARQTGVSEAALIREAITTYVTTIKRLRPSIVGSVSVEGVEGRDTEDYLLEHWRPE
ncbi:MAG: CopG family transcriptional regulator [Thermomicrobiales bacterium]|nr:CopG family transcriptional regulator [Thermomicrobiales bacterium]